jgi:hypothetical protein
MNTTLIAQLKIKHQAALSCLALIEHGNAEQKNIAGEWYESFVIDIIEMQVPENEKPVYHELDWDAHNDAIDNVLNSDMRIDEFGIYLTPENQ